MKPSAVKLFAFSASLLIGIATAWFFFVDNKKVESVVQEVPSSEIIGNGPVTVDEEFVPEFTKVEIDEEPAKTTMQMELARNGEVDLCTIDPSKENKKWLGLFKRGNNFVFERRFVSFGRVEHTDFGSFARMRFNDSLSAILMLTDQGALQPGPVKTLYLKPALNDDGMEIYGDGMFIGDWRDFNLGEADYRVRIAPATLKTGGKASLIVLERGSESQLIWFKTFFFPDEVGELEWVGDMDRDNRLDLLFSSYAQNGGQLESFLFLSSFAKEENLVGFAGFHTAKCRAFPAYGN